MKSSDDRRDILAKAFRRLDPENDLVPGTPAYNDTESLILKWIRIHGPDRTLHMVERSVKLMMSGTLPQQGVFPCRASKPPAR